MSAVNRKADESVLDELLSAYCANKDVKELERNLSDRGVIAARVVPLLNSILTLTTRYIAAGLYKRLSMLGRRIIPAWKPVAFF